MGREIEDSSLFSSFMIQFKYLVNLCMDRFYKSLTLDFKRIFRQLWRKWWKNPRCKRQSCHEKTLPKEIFLTGYCALLQSDVMCKIHNIKPVKTLYQTRHVYIITDTNTASIAIGKEERRSFLDSKSCMEWRFPMTLSFYRSILQKDQLISFAP